MKRLAACLVGILTVLGPMAARGQTGATHPYKLSDTSRFETGCFTICDCATFSQPLRGTFLLEPVTIGPLFDDYRVLDIRWTLPDSVPGISITGSGTYRVGGEVAVQHQMTLDLSVGGGPVQHFDSGLVETTNGFPRIEIRVPLHGDSACVDTVLLVHASPAAPTATGVETASPERAIALRAVHANPFRDQADLALQVAQPGDVMIDILDIHGRLVRRWSLQAVAPGDHPFVWDGRDGSGNDAATGVYLVRARQHGRVAVARVLRIR